MGKKSQAQSRADLRREQKNSAARRRYAEARALGINPRQQFKLTQKQKYILENPATMQDLFATLDAIKRGEL